jgi:hypothetical protein
MQKKIENYLIPSVCLLVLTIVMCLSWYLQVFAQPSPIAFDSIEVKDLRNDWIKIPDGRNTTNGMNATDISSVKYDSDGKSFNANLWFSSLKELTSNAGRPSVYEIRYGMLIDRDLNNETGYQGIDYQVEIVWDKSTGKWSRHLNELNAGGIIESNPNQTTPNYDGFYTDKVVKLGFPLKDISPGKNYRVFVYAYNSNKNATSPWTLDVVRWIFIPPPEFQLKAVQDTIDTTQNNNKTADIKIETTLTKTGVRPEVEFIDTKPATGVTMKYNPSSLNMSSQEGGAELTVATSSVDTRDIPITVKAKATLPTQYFNSFLLSKNTKNTARYVIPSQEIDVNGTTFHLKVSEDAPLWSPLTKFWKDLGEFVAFIYIPLSLVAGWVAKHLYEREHNSRQRRYKRVLSKPRKRNSHEGEQQETKKQRRRFGFRRKEQIHSGNVKAN